MINTYVTLPAERVLYLHKIADNEYLNHLESMIKTIKQY